MYVFFVSSQPGEEMERKRGKLSSLATNQENLNFEFEFEFEIEQILCI